ncbi:MAG: DDE-type integrase/transposase/recombinase [Nanoarchaeota archaeon]
MFKCPHCKTNSAIKRGVKKNKSGWIPRFSCTKCGKWFVDRKGFENYRHSSEVITAALDLRAKGLSLADVVDHLDQHHRVKVSRQTILDWQNKFGKKLKSFSQCLTPHLGKIFHADEMFVKQKKNGIYYWDCIDYDTKFLLADHISEERNFDEGTMFLRKIKLGSLEIPDEIHKDNSFDYPIAFKRVFPRKKIHKHYPAWKFKFKNNPIERLHNTLKQRYKVFRGFDNTQSAEKFFDFYRIYYNFIRKHMTLGMITPALAAGIKLNLGRNRFKSLIEILLVFYRVRFCL